LNARILSELTNIIAPTRIYQFAGVFHIRKPLKANNSIVEITSAYTKTGIVKSPRLGSSTAIMMIRYAIIAVAPIQKIALFLVFLGFICLLNNRI
jgi:hypothetical protein